MQATATLDLYVLGPGVGESVVMVMPDGRVVVVDCCAKGGSNLPGELLKHLGVTGIDLLVVTHPDLDHIKDLDHLVRDWGPKRVWRHPPGLLREVLQTLGGLQTPSGSPRYSAALAASDALEDLLKGTGCVEHVTAGRDWSPPNSGYRVVAFAPTPYDVERASARTRNLVERTNGQPTLSVAARAMFNGTKPLGDLPNMVSLGLVVEWGPRKVVLAGDVENGDGTPHSGWRGVLNYLDQPDYALAHLVADVDVVKVAHHGSSGAMASLAWARHAANAKPVALLTPFAPTPLPHDAVLAALRPRATMLGITADQGGASPRAKATGWVPAGLPATLPIGAALRVQIPQAGSLSVALGAEAAWFK